MKTVRNFIKSLRLKEVRKKLFPYLVGGLIILIPVVYLTIIKAGAVQAGWFDEGWLYRKPITFTHNAEIASPRRVTITINTSELIAAEKMQSDCDDVRFTDYNGLLLDFQLTGSCNNTASTYDVIFPFIENGVTSGFIYYGNNHVLGATQDVSGITSLSPSGGAASIGTEVKGPAPTVYIKFDEGTGSTFSDSMKRVVNAIFGGAEGAATDIKIRQEINIVDALVSTSGDNEALIELDTSMYSGTVAYYFEVVGKVDSGTLTVALERSGTSTQDATIAFTETSFTRKRSTAFTPPGGATEYNINLASGTNPQVKSARIIIIQTIPETSTLTSTQTQIEIGNLETTKSNTAPAPLNSPKYWYFDENKWDGAVTAVAEVTYKLDLGLGDNVSETITTTGTWPAPSWISTVQVEVWGGGGGGGRARGNPSTGGGGAGGAYAIDDVAVTPSSSYTVTVGTGGSGSTGTGTTTQHGSAGNPSWFSTSGTVFAQGGAGGQSDGNAANTNGAGATGSSASSIGDTVYRGGNGSTGDYTSTTGYSGAGGGGAGSTGDGGDASAGTGGTGTTFGGGNGANGVGNNTIGVVGSTFGGGGSGGKANNNTDRNGAAGGDGAVRLTYTGLADHTAEIKLQVDDGSFGNWTDVTSGTIVSAGDSSSVVRVRSGAFTPITGRNYRLVSSITNAGSTYDIYNAKIIINQAGTSITKLEPQYLLANTAFTAGTSLQNFDTYYDPADWTGATVDFFHDGMGANGSTSSIKLQSDPNGTPADVTGSTVTPANRTRSSEITMPGSADTIDVIATTNNSDIYASAIVAQTTIPINPSESGVPTWGGSSNCLTINCLYFNGVDALATIYENFNYNFGEGITDEFTVSYWANPLSVGATNPGYIFWKGDDSYIRFEEGTDSKTVDLAVSLDLSSSNATVSIPDIIPTAQWSNIIVTYSDDGDDEITVYVNGLEIAQSSNGSGSLVTETQPIVFGANGGVGSYFYHGYIDEFKIYNYAITDSKAKQFSNINSSVSGSGSTIGYTSTNILTQGLVGYWKMDENISGDGESITDHSGYSNDGLTKYGANTTGMDCTGGGKYRTGCALDGTDDYIEITSSPEISPRDAITVTAWVKPNEATKTSWQEVVMKSSSNTDNSRQYFLRPQQTTGYVNGGVYINGTNYQAVGNEIEDDVWTHIAMTFSSTEGKVKVYRNGVLEGTTDTPNDLAQDIAGTLAIGRLGGYSAEYFDGAIDEVRIYNRTLSEKDINDLYTWAPAPEAAWDFDEGTGSYANDAEGYNSVLTKDIEPNIPVLVDDADTIQAGTDTSVSVTFNDIPENGELIILNVGQAHDNASIGMTAPSGFILKVEEEYVSPGFGRKNEVWYKYADNEVSATYTFTYPSTWRVIQLSGSRWINTKQSGDPFGESATDTNYGTTATGLSVNSSVENSVHLFFNAYDQGNSITPPSGYTEFFDNSYGYGAYKLIPDSGITGDVSITIPGDFWVTISIILLPNEEVNIWDNGKFGSGLVLEQGKMLSAFDSPSLTNAPTALASGSNNTTAGSTITTASVSPTVGKKLLIFVTSQSNNHTNGYNWGITASTGTTPTFVNNTSSYVFDASTNYVQASALFELTPTAAGARTFTIDPNTSSGSDFYSSYTIIEIDIFDSYQIAKAGGATVTPSSDSATAALSLDNEPLTSNMVIALFGIGNDSSGASTVPTGFSTIVNQTQTFTKVGAFYLAAPDITTASISDLGQSIGAWAGFILEIQSADLSTDPNSVDNFIKNNYSVSAWISTNYDNSTNSTIVAKTNGSGAYPVHLYLNSSEQPCFQISDGTNSPSVCGSTSISDNAWHHVTGVRDTVADMLYLYLDGTLVSSTADTTTTEVQNSPLLSIGRSGVFYDEYQFTGKIDEVKIYNYPITPNHVITEMNGGHPLGGSPVGSQMIYWRFDEANGTTVNNAISSQAALTGTRSGALWKLGSNCKVNGCLQFVNTTDNVSGGSPTFFDTAEEVTFSMWLYPTALAVDRSIVSKHDNSSNAFAIRTDGTNSDELRIQIASGATDTSNYLTTSGFDLATDTWTHLLVVYDGTQVASDRIKVFKNGEPRTGTITGTIPTEIRTSTANLRVGQAHATYSSLAAYIDEVKIYNSALSNASVLIDLNAGSSASFSVLSAQNNQGTGFLTPKVWWKLNENTGASTILDSSGNEVSLTMNAMAESNWVSGYQGAGLFFDGSTNYLSCTDGTCGGTGGGLDFGASDSFSFGARYTLTTSSTYHLLSKKSNTSLGTAGYAAQTFGLHRPRCMIADGAAQVTVDSLGSSFRPVFTHFTCVVNRTTNIMEIYVDGMYRNSADISTVGSLDSTTEFRVASIGGATSSRFTGILNDIYFYDGVLTPAQIAYKHNRGKPFMWLKFDECTGATTYDSSGWDKLSAGITIGGSGSQTSVGDCNTSGTAWENGSIGKIGSSINFDGTDDYAAFTGANPAPIYRDFFFATWIKKATTNDAVGLITKTNSTTNWDYEFGINSSNSLYLYTQTPGPTTLTSTGTITDSEWHHVAVGRDGSDVSFYIDGREVGTGSLSGDLAHTGTARVYIGAGSYAGPNEFFNGQMDDVRVYPYKLNQDQLLNLINQTANSFKE